MALINIKEQVILKDLTELKGAIRALQTKVETDGGLNAGVKAEFGLIQETIDDISQAIADPLYVRLNERRNMLTPTINRLPVELLTYIILLTNESIGIPRNKYTHPYLSYTWVCRHWRAVLIQSPVFWTTIKPQLWQDPHLKTLDDELLRRTKSAKLDVSLASYCSTPLGCDTLLKDLFKEGSRIRTLALLSHQDEVVQLIPSAKQFPSLQTFIFVRRYSVMQDHAFSHLLPILVASDHLETFECTLPLKGWDGIQNYLAVILGRLRNLSLKIFSSAVAQSVLDLLCNNNNTKLQKLQLIMDFVDDMSETYEHTETLFSAQATFPELQSLSVNNLLLLGYFQAPKLSGLTTCWESNSCILDYPIFNKFNFSSIRYLYIRSWPRRNTWKKGYCILGSKEHVPDLTSYTETNTFDNVVFPAYPRDYFHLRFGLLESAIFEMALREALSSTIPRLTSLVELHLLFPQTHSVCRKIIPRVSSIQKLVVGPGNALMDLLRLLSNPSRCPQLTHLSYTTSPLPKNLEEYADDVGRNLTNCLQSRQNDSPGDALKYINLINCPPLPDNWLEELQKLGADVITKKDSKCIQKQSYQHMQAIEI